jgi:hypothetical protein
VASPVFYLPVIGSPSIRLIQPDSDLNAKLEEWDRFRA